MPTNPTTLRIARRLRRHMSLPETVLWRLLRTKPSGIKIRRQHPIGPYVIDFYAPELRLAIEIDGIAHDMGTRPERDETRDAWLEERGFTVLRIAAGEVLADPIVVADAIVALCLARRSPSTTR